MKSCLVTISKFRYAVLQQKYKLFLNNTLNQAQEQAIYQPYELLLDIDKFNNSQLLVMFQKGLFVEDQHRIQYEFIQNYFSPSLSITQEIYKLVWSEDVRQIRTGLTFIHHLGKFKKPEQPIYLRLLENYFNVLKKNSLEDKFENLNIKNYMFLQSQAVKELLHKNVVDIIQQHCSKVQQLPVNELFYIFGSKLFNRLDFPILYETLFNKVFPKLRSYAVSDIALQLSILYNITNRLPQFYIENLIQKLDKSKQYTPLEQLQIHNIIFQLRRNFKVEKYDQQFKEILSNLKQLSPVIISQCANEELQIMKQIKNLYSQVCRKLNIQDKMHIYKEWIQLKYDTKYFRSVLNCTHLFQNSKKITDYINQQNNIKFIHENPLFGDNLSELLINLEQKQKTIESVTKRTLQIQNNLKNPKQIINRISGNQIENYKGPPQILLCQQVKNFHSNVAYLYTNKNLIQYIANNPYLYTKIVLTPVCRYMLTKFLSQKRIITETNYWDFPYFYHFKITKSDKMLLIYLRSPLLCDKYEPSIKHSSNNKQIYIEQIKNYLNIIDFVKNWMKNKHQTIENDQE